MVGAPGRRARRASSRRLPPHDRSGASAWPCRARYWRATRRRPQSTQPSDPRAVGQGTSSKCVGWAQLSYDYIRLHLRAGVRAIWRARTRIANGFDDPPDGIDHKRWLLDLDIVVAVLGDDVRRVRQQGGELVLTGPPRFLEAVGGKSGRWVWGQGDRLRPRNDDERNGMERLFGRCFGHSGRRRSEVDHFDSDISQSPAAAAWRPRHRPSTDRGRAAPADPPARRRPAPCPRPRRDRCWRRDARTGRRASGRRAHRGRRRARPRAGRAAQLRSRRPCAAWEQRRFG